ncbi:Gfo/Idh/MocA family protein [Isoptericola variabilis]|uniref:Oxidoreductase domain protein n=1 Tax=Isoptericola variabilis (strain 225) TaxID=743718 RepID=F6FU75_ISOV2|nr:Gfo/Idh/MocA family oxidoreductase [Isoptericola variabilis]AEG43271.1 oxidoreductase domain protein [Isoptericola variabilis 225]TWH35206.1 putative dehydrogenase [Isoptericola variabilis J7]
MKVSILGAGAIAHAHAQAIQGLARYEGLEDVELAHVVDVDPARAEEFATTFGAPKHSTDLATALAPGETDVLHVCTPPSLHLEQARAALAAGVHVVVEKPAVLSLAEVDALAVAEQEAARGARFTQIVQHRFGAGALRLRRLLADGTLGRPLVATCDTLWFRPPAYFEVPWRGRFDTEGGGPTMGHGIHQFDLLVSVLGPWVEVRAMAGRLAREVDTEDVSMAIVRFANGAMASITNSLLSPRETSFLRFDTEAATLELEHLYGYDDASWTVTPVPGREDVAERWAADVAQVADGGPSGHLAQLVPTYRALAAGQTPPVTVGDARGTLELAAAIYKSAFTGAPVVAGEITPGDPFYASMGGTGAPWPAVKHVPVEEAAR